MRRRCGDAAACPTSRAASPQAAGGSLSMSRRKPPAPRRDWAYFFDLDGTLIDFAETPSGVRVGADVRLLLERLCRSTGGAVALMSGRPIAELDRLFPHVRMPAAGQHGLER